MGENILEIYVDAENVSYKEMDRIVSYVEKNEKKYMGRVAKNIKIHIYKLENSEYTKKWDTYIDKNSSKMYQKNVNLVPHNLEGKREKNKVDNQIIMALKKKLHFSNSSVFILVASDGDYSEIVRKIKNSKNYIVVIGNETASSKLREAADEFVDFQSL